MKNSDYTFGECEVTCDAKDCNNSETIDGFDGHPPQYSDVNDEIRDSGWYVGKENGDWVDYCPQHNPKKL